jgi:TetR/AcrR family transcriptional regulator, fatty acid metabolism regulator protein
MRIHSAMAKTIPRQQPQTPPATKRQRILRAATDVFAQSGYFNAKVSDIAKSAGVADGTIYLYFDGKEDLLVNIFREHTRSYLQSLERDLTQARRAEERVRVAIRHHLQSLGRDRSLAIVAQVELRHSLKFMALLSHQEVADYLNILRKIVEQGQNEGVFRRTLNPQLVAKSIFGILDEMVTSWVLSDKEYILEEQAEPIAEFVLNGLL